SPTTPRRKRDRDRHHIIQKRSVVVRRGGQGRLGGRAPGVVTSNAGFTAGTSNTHNATSFPSASTFPPAQPEFNFPGPGPAEDQHHQKQQKPNPDEMEVEDQMDWLGDKLSQLIEQGKRALNREVVVMSDSKEDEEDDGSGGWEEEEDGDQGGLNNGNGNGSPSRSISVSRNGSVRRAGNAN
ncbi:hypothetical protein H0H93_016069, partial [Arthromyces matolae]